MVGEDTIDSFQALKSVVDPKWILGRGVLFEKKNKGSVSTSRSIALSQEKTIWKGQVLRRKKIVIVRAQSGDRRRYESNCIRGLGYRFFRGVILARLPDVDQAEDVLWDTFRIVFEKDRAVSNL